MKLIKTINLFLAILIIILILNLLMPINQITGNIVYSLDRSAPKCYFHYEDFNEVPINLCCHELEKQINCESTHLEGEYYKCYVSRKSEKYYLTNSKTIKYCKKEGYNVKIK